LAELLRDIHTIASTYDEDLILVLLNRLKIEIEKYDIISNGTLDNLIRNRLINNEMATSLMNDTTYAYNISKNLIEMAQLLFVHKNSTLTS
jgi:phosphate:Na+ symporter